MSGIRALALAVMPLACGGGPAAPPSPTDIRQPVVEYFAAVDAGDCDRLRANVAGAAAERLAGSGCQAELSTFVEHGGQLVSVGQVRADGRNPARRLVDTRVRVGSTERTIVVGVRQAGGRWVVDEI